MKRFRNTEVWKYIRTLLEMIGLALLILALIHACEWVIGQAKAEEEFEPRWVICHDALLVREYPSKRSVAVGELEPGTMVWTDGKTRNGYTHLVNLANETGDGWVGGKYLIGEEPYRIDREATVVSRGRLAARKTMGGKLRTWLKPLSTVMVYWLTSEWAVTEKGYVMVKYLEFN